MPDQIIYGAIIAGWILALYCFFVEQIFRK